MNRLSPSVIRGPHREGGGLQCRVTVWPSAGPRLPRALPIAWFRPRFQKTDIDLLGGGRENAARIQRGLRRVTSSGAAASDPLDLRRLLRAVALGTNLLVPHLPRLFKRSTYVQVWVTL